MIKLNELKRQTGMTTRLSVEIAKYIMNNKGQPVYIVAFKKHMANEVLRKVKEYLSLHDSELNLPNVQVMSYDTYTNNSVHLTNVKVFFDEPEWINRDQEMNFLNFLCKFTISGFANLHVEHEHNYDFDLNYCAITGMTITIMDIDPVYRYIIERNIGIGGEWLNRLVYNRTPISLEQIDSNKLFTKTVGKLMDLYNTEMEYIELGELSVQDILDINSGRKVLLKRNFSGDSDDIITKVGNVVTGNGGRICLVRGKTETIIKDTDSCRLVSVEW